MKKYLILVIIIFFGLIINETYAIFYSNISKNTKLPIAKWNITLNDENITNTYTNIIDIKNIIWENEYANEKKVAPGSKGSFDIEIDSNDTEVSFLFEISYIDHTIDENKILTVTNIRYDGSDLIKISDNKYICIFPINSNYKTISVDLEWINNENNNEIDSSIGFNGEMQTVEFIFKASQYYGQDIIGDEND